MQETKNLRDTLDTIKNASGLMASVNMGGALTIDLSVLLDDEETKEMIAAALEKKIRGLGEENEKYKLSCEDGEFAINGKMITQEAEEEVGWQIRDRKDFIDILKYEWIPETRQAGRSSDLTLMEQDLEYLEGFNDELILSSLSTNAYLIPSNSTDFEEYEETCERLLEESEGN